VRQTELLLLLLLLLLCDSLAVQLRSLIDAVFGLLAGLFSAFVDDNDVGGVPLTPAAAAAAVSLPLLCLPGTPSLSS
jgi:hypothetical protein